MPSTHLAIDLGAESGRVIVGTLDAGRLSLHEAHRFRHLPVPTPAGLCWDLTGLWRHILDGLRAAGEYCAAEGLTPESVGVDTWGVDFALLSKQGVLLGLPRCYRDPAFDDAFDRVTQRLEPRAIYEATGIQLMALNSLYQLEARYTQEPELFDSGGTSGGGSLHFMPDLLHHLLSGVATVERTIASTSQMVDARTGDWNRGLLQQLGLPDAMLRTPVDPGTVIGPITPEVAAATGLPASVRVVLPPGHDTACAVAAVPTEPNSSWCYLSSGTWSLLGAELDAPRIDDATAAANFTNELGVTGTVRFLKNISGLFLVQEVRRDLQRRGDDLDYPELTALAGEAEPGRCLVPVADPAFARLGDAASRLQRYARQTGQPVPETPGQLVRACLDSLALEYRRTLAQLESLLGRTFDVLHVVGGGGKNQLLNQLAADATGKPVVVGPEEATAAGNVLVQAIGCGHLPDLTAARRVVRDSTELSRVEPSGTDFTGSAERYAALPAVDDGA
ncbi:MAG: rhamnulokinase family protein [Planctomycetota bacterium]